MYKFIDLDMTYTYLCIIIVRVRRRILIKIQKHFNDGSESYKTAFVSISENFPTTRSLWNEIVLVVYLIQCRH
jgi:hypothetical protein